MVPCPLPPMCFALPCSVTGVLQRLLCSACLHQCFHTSHLFV
jgi:hypothetical protein